MINLVKQMDRNMVYEAIEEQNKALYWMEKKLKKDPRHTARTHMSLMSKTIVDRSFNTTEPVEYNAPSGNKWLSFFITNYSEEEKRYVTAQVALCYIETVGSMGVVFPFDISSEMTEYHFGLENPRNIFRFNSHFFFQMSERMGVNMKSKEMLDKFLELTHTFKFNVRDEEKDGMYAIDLIWKDEFIGRGYACVDKENNYIVYDVRTFLKISQLSYAQRKYIGNVIDTERPSKCAETEGEVYERFFSGSNEPISNQEETMLYNAVIDEFMMMSASFGLKFRPDEDDMDFIRPKLTSKYKIMFRRKDRNIYNYYKLFAEIMNISLYRLSEHDVNCFHLGYMLDKTYNLTREEFEKLSKKKSFEHLVKVGKQEFGLTKEDVIRIIKKAAEEKEANAE